MHGGLNINSVPDEAVIGIDIRTVPTDARALREQLSHALGPDVELQTLLDVESVYTEPQNEWVQSVFDVMQPHLGSRPEPRAATYFTDAAALKPRARQSAHRHPRSRRAADGAPDRRVLPHRTHRAVDRRVHRDHPPLDRCMTV